MTSKYIPYSTQHISTADIEAVANTLKSGWLTGGSAVVDFERNLADYCKVKYGIAFNSGTAALHGTIRSLRISPDDEIIVPSISFIATANCVLYEQGIPVFCDVEPDTLLIDVNKIERLISQRTKAIIAVDFAGQLCNYPALHALCKQHNLTLIADACHSLGARSGNFPSGSLADMTVFSFHPVKQITTGEGGMVMCNSQEIDSSCRKFRNHEMSSDAKERMAGVGHEYTIKDLGYNYRLTDIQAALGLSQLSNLDKWLERRRDIADQYDQAFSENHLIKPLIRGDTQAHGNHLYVVRVDQRDTVFKVMRKKKIGVNVHYKPIHLHDLYKNRLGTSEGLCPVAEKQYKNILSIPIYPGLTVEEQNYIIESLHETVNGL